MSSRRFWDWFIFPGGIWIALLFAVPLMLVLALSFGHVDDFGRGVYGFSLDNYRDVFDATYVPVLIRSVAYALATVILCLLIGYPVAYFIARYGGKYRYALLAALVIPFFVNYLVRTYAWVALLADQGLINNLLVDWGFTQEPIQMINTPYAVIGGLVYGYIGLVEGLIGRIREEVAWPCRVVATGGFAPVVADRSSAIDVVDDALVLEGLRLIHLRNAPTRAR